MKIEMVGFSETGLQRNYNEDCIFMGQSYHSAIAVVADGMGGYRDGARASRSVCGYMSSWWNEYIKRPILPSPEKSALELENMLRLANDKIREERQGDYLCGTTVVVLFVQDRSWGLISAGDSRCYRLKVPFFTAQLEQISQDDTWENQQDVKKRFSPNEIRNNPQYGYLVSAVGASERLNCHKIIGKLKSKDVFGLFSDGVYRYCDKSILKKSMLLFDTKERGDELLSQIRSAVYRQNAPDNLSAVMLKVSL